MQVSWHVFQNEISQHVCYQFILLWIHLSSTLYASGSDCPPRWKSFGDSCYLNGNGPMTWVAANYDCKRSGGQLAVIKNSVINNLLLKVFLKTDNRPHWFGLQRCGENRWCLPNWNMAGRYFNWAKGQPNNYGGYEGCACIQSNGDWTDALCRVKYPYICSLRKGSSKKMNQGLLVSQLNTISNTLKSNENKTAATLDRMENMLNMLPKVLEAKVGSYQMPGTSCSDILQQRKEKLLPSQAYWIIKDYKPMKVFCDMKTDGGGWTLITNIVLPDSSGFTWALATEYRKISDYNSKRLGLSVSALQALKHKMPFTQLMFYCHKKIPGRTFHIVTKPNSLGNNVVRYFTGQSNSLPKSCGSFTRLSDDNSTMARECSKWGRESGKYTVGKWHLDGVPVANRLINYPAFIASKAHWLLPNTPGGRWECDDYISISGFARTAGDFWKIFVR